METVDHLFVVVHCVFRLISATLVLRLVDNKAILYFDAPSPSDALNWYRGLS